MALAVNEELDLHNHLLVGFLSCVLLESFIYISTMFLAISVQCTISVEGHDLPSEHVTTFFVSTLFVIYFF